jgi:hypothetical protein
MKALLWSWSEGTGSDSHRFGRQVDVQWDAMYVRLLDPRTGQLLREHLGQKRGGHRIRPEDRPRRTPPYTMQLLARRIRREPASV